MIDSALDVRRRSFFESIWSEQLSVNLSNLAFGKREFREIREATNLISKDYNGRFLFELLQNGSDASRKAGLDGASIAIVRDEEFAAVANEGDPFDEQGVNDIIRLAISRKEPSVDLGNKGVGFNAVYEVTEAPIIFSGPRGAFSDVGGYCFILAENPFNKETAETFRAVAMEVVEKCGDLAGKLDGGDPCEILLDSVRETIGFKFPIYLDKVEAAAWRRKLPELSSFSSVVVLPFRGDAAIEGRVESVFNEFYSNLEEICLFLPAISRISVFDRKHSKSIMVERVVRRGDIQPSGALIEDVRILRNVDGRTFESRWFLATRKLGDLAGNRCEGDKLLRRAIPLGEKWKTVRGAVVRVALPILEEEMPYSVSGRFFIGLPTNMETGAPVCVDTSFYSQISRKNIDFGEDLNQFLLEKCHEITREMLDFCKQSNDLTIRRLVSFARGLIRREHEGLGKMLYGGGGYYESECILNYSGDTYILPGDAKLPSPESMRAFTGMGIFADFMNEIGIYDIEDFLTPHIEVLLTPDEIENLYLNCDSYLKRMGRRSPLERIAKRLQEKASQSNQWEAFFDWIADWEISEEMRRILFQQKIIPVVGGRMMAPVENVFLPPRQFSPGEAGGLDDEDDDEEESIDIPEEIIPLLHFVDSALHVREPDGIRLTQLGHRLSPDYGSRFVRRPNLRELMEFAVLQAMNRESDRNPDSPRCFLLLETAISLLHRPRAKGLREEAAKLGFPVPVAGRAMAWMNADDVFFGEGWLESRHEELLRKAVKEGAYLLDWEDFSRRIRSGERGRPKEWWRAGLMLLGVRHLPRRLEALPQSAQRAIFSASSSGLKIIKRDWDIPLGLPDGIEALWTRYLRRIQGTGCGHSSNNIPYGFDEVVWIEGLEDSVRRSAVVELLLMNPAYYRDVTASVERKDGRYQSIPVDAFWLSALKNEGWEVIPAQDGKPASPGELWYNGREMAVENTQYEHLRTVARGFDIHAELLRRLGIWEIGDAPAEKVISELHRLAIRICKDSSLAPSRTLKTLITSLYERLDILCSMERINIDALLSGRIPLLHEDILDGVEPVAIDSVFIEDDRERRCHVRGARDGYFVPARSRNRLNDLAERIAERVAVLHTSTAPLAIQLRDRSEQTSLVSYIEREHGFSSVVHIGCLIAYGMADTHEPESESFVTLWEPLLSARLSFAALGEQPNAVTEPLEEGGGKCLIVRNDGRKSETVLRSIWLVIGSAFRDIVTAYCDALSRGSVDDFMRQREIGESEQQLMREHLYRTGLHQITSMHPAAYLVKRETNPEITVEEFRMLVRDCCDADSLLRIALADYEVAKGAINMRDDSTSSLSMALLSRYGIDVDIWQQARSQFGLQPFVFEESRRIFQDAISRLVSRFKIFAISASRGKRMLNRLANFIETLRATKIPDAVLLRPSSREEALAMIIVEFHRLEATAEEPVKEVLTSFTSKELSRVVGERMSRKEGEYFHRGSDERVERVIDVLNHYRGPLMELGRQYGIDASPALESRELNVLQTAEWANCYILLETLKETLRNLAPQMAERLAEIDAFASPLSENELRLKLNMKPKEGDAAVSEVEVAGMRIPGDSVDREIAKGPGGPVGAIVKKLVEEAPAFLDILAGERAAVERCERRGPSRRTSRGRPRPSGSNESTGAVGEIFVYELLSSQLGSRGFDHQCWVSGNAGRYLGKDCDDTAGYDFEYLDEDGSFGAPGKRCLIEVKTTSGHDLSFPMSEAEWERARRAHSCEEEEYFIIRVCGMDEKPYIADILRDPISLEREGKIFRQPFNSYVRPGKRTVPGGNE